MPWPQRSLATFRSILGINRINRVCEKKRCRVKYRTEHFSDCIFLFSVTVKNGNVAKIGLEGEILPFKLAVARKWSVQLTRDPMILDSVVFLHRFRRLWVLKDGRNWPDQHTSALYGPRVHVSEQAEPMCLYSI